MWDETEVPSGYMDLIPIYLPEGSPGFQRVHPSPYPPRQIHLGPPPPQTGLGEVKVTSELMATKEQPHSVGTPPDSNETYSFNSHHPESDSP